MVREWIFQGIEFSPSEAWLQNRRAETEDWFSGELAVEISIVNCFDLTELEPIKDKTALSSYPIAWKKPISLLCRDSAVSSRFALLSFHKGVRREVAKVDLSLLNINPTSLSQLKLLDEEGKEIGKLCCRISEVNKQNIPILILKAIRCELIRDEQKLKTADPYLSCSSFFHQYRSEIRKGRLLWLQPMTIFMEDEYNFKLQLLDQLTGQSYFELEMKYHCFMLQRGIKKAMLTNKQHYHMGCIDLEYQTEGLRSQEQYTLYAQIEEKLSKQMIKIFIKHIKVKLRQPQTGVYVKILAGNNIIESSCNNETTPMLNFDIQDFIYADIHEQKCNFALYSKKEDDKEEVIGNGVMILDMMGNFEKRIGILPQNGKKQIGFLIVGVRSQKVDCQKLFVRDLIVRCESEFTCKKVYMKMKIGGWFCRTENAAYHNEMSYSKELQLRYSTQVQINCFLMDENNQILAQRVLLLSDLQQKRSSFVLEFKNQQRNVKAKAIFNYLLDDWKKEAQRELQKMMKLEETTNAISRQQEKVKSFEEIEDRRVQDRQQIKNPQQQINYKQDSKDLHKIVHLEPKQSTTQSKEISSIQEKSKPDTKREKHISPLLPSKNRMNKQSSKKLKSTNKNTTFGVNLGNVNQSILQIYLGNNFHKTLLRKANKSFRITHNSSQKTSRGSSPTQKYLDILLPKAKNQQVKALGFHYERADRKTKLSPLKHKK